MAPSNVRMHATRSTSFATVSCSRLAANTKKSAPTAAAATLRGTRYALTAPALFDFLCLVLNPTCRSIRTHCHLKFSLTQRDPFPSHPRIHAPRSLRHLFTFVTFENLSGGAPSERGENWCRELTVWRKTGHTRNRFLSRRRGGQIGVGYACMRAGGGYSETALESRRGQD